MIRDEGRKPGHGKQEEPFWFEIVDRVLLALRHVLIPGVHSPPQDRHCGQVLQSIPSMELRMKT